MAGKFDFWLGVVGLYKEMAKDPKWSVENVGNTRGHGGYGSRVVKCSWNTTTDELKLNDDKSVMFKNDYVTGICEYEPDCLAVTHLKNENIYKVSEGLTKIEPMVPPEAGLNDNKSFIEAMPGFHATEYPFLLVTGKVQTWLVNVQTKKSQTLFTCSSRPAFAQPGVVFHVTTPELKCLYAHQTGTTSGKLQFSIYEMTLFKDFERVLRDLGLLPEVSVKRTVQLELEVKKLKEKLAAAGIALE